MSTTHSAMPFCAVLFAMLFLTYSSDMPLDDRMEVGHVLHKTADPSALPLAQPHVGHAPTSCVDHLVSASASSK
jgi:hypothetical protein